ncbi:MAG: FISUMP domain-containing protein, partial [Ignavibacteria bacterium]
MTKYIMLLLMGFIAQGCLSPEFNNPVERGTIPTLSSPSDGAAGLSVSPVLSWNAVPEDASYTLQVSSDNSFSNPVYSKSGLISTSDVVSQWVTGLSYLTKYYWRVCQTNNYGTSDWSGVWSFTTTGATPGTPTLSLPNNGASDQSVTPTLSWSAVTGATGYTLQVSKDQWFSSFVYNQSGITNTSRQVTGLNNAVTYYWRVSAANSYGTSGWSGVWSFTTAAASQFTCGTSTVTYSGKTYHTVQIGSQCWLKENLDVGTMVNGSRNQINNGTTEKYCYDDKPSNCATYGGLYQWDEAMAYSTTPGSKGICPTGWHIPTDAEYQTLIASANNNSNVLK